MTIIKFTAFIAHNLIHNREQMISEIRADFAKS